MDFSQPHQRYNPLRKSWVLCSPHRTQRPWQGQQETAQVEKRPQYDSKCYLCPGNTRANGSTNPKYEQTFVFVNDFAAVKPRADLPDPSAVAKEDQDELFQAEAVTGKCVVICFSPRHDLTLAQMTQDEVVRVIDAWKDVYQDAVENPEVNYCQIFENKGQVMGCSNPHPHGQAWMTSIIPEEPSLEHASLKEYQSKHGRGLLEDYIAKELQNREKPGQDRIVEDNDSFVALVPYWAVWPFETMVVCKTKVGNVTLLTSKQQSDFAEILRRLALRYDNLFSTSFPYSMGLHQSFASSSSTEDVEHLHVHFYPPLLRSATVRKFLVGFEMLGMPQRDITPESAADMLRKVDSSAHYSEKRYD